MSDLAVDNKINMTFQAPSFEIPAIPGPGWKESTTAQISKALILLLIQNYVTIRTQIIVEIHPIRSQVMKSLLSIRTPLLTEGGRNN